MVPCGSWFTTILPPNSVSAVRDDLTSGGILSPSSYHAGGVNVAMGDGSVRFVSETINAVSSFAPVNNSLANAKVVTSGPSHFGVWGALGSRDGGESASLP